MDRNSNLPTIKFSYNWNNKIENKAFTTLRLHNNGKYLVGQRYKIELKGQSKGVATLLRKQVLRLCEINEFMSYIDTGYSLTETVGIIKRMYNGIEDNALMDFCLLVYDNDKKESPQLSISF